MNILLTILCSLVLLESMGVLAIGVKVLVNELKDLYKK